MTTEFAVIPEDINAFKALRDPWIQPWLDRNWRALRRMCTSNIRFVPREGSPVEGPRACRAYLLESAVLKTFTFEFERILGLEECGYARGPFAAVTEIDGEGIATEGKISFLFAKVEDEWLIYEVNWKPT